MNFFNFDFGSIALSTIIAAILAITLPQVIAALSTVIGVVFPFVYGKYLKGYRTKIIAILTTIIGLMMLVSDKILPGLSEIFKLNTESITGIIVVLLGFIQYVLRLVTDTPSGEMKLSKLSKRFTGSKAEIRDEIAKLSK